MKDCNNESSMFSGLRRIRLRADSEIIDTMMNELRSAGFRVTRGPVISGGLLPEFTDVYFPPDIEDQAILCRILCDYAGKSGWISGVSPSHDEPFKIAGENFPLLLSVIGLCYECDIAPRL